MIYHSKQKNIYEKGYTLLFAVLVTSIVLSVTLSIISISKKEFLLASSARESQFAFYAADSGMECAVYFEGAPVLDGGDIFASTTPNRKDSVTCDGHSVNIEHDDSVTDKTKDIFNINLDGSSCGIVEVDKSYFINGDHISFDTWIISRGYNTGWDAASLACNTPSSKRVERELRLFRRGD